MVWKFLYTSCLKACICLYLCVLSAVFASSWQPPDLEEAPHIHIRCQGHLPVASFTPSTIQTQSHPVGWDTEPPWASGGNHRSCAGGQVSPGFNAAHNVSSATTASAPHGDKDIEVSERKDTMLEMTTIKKHKNKHTGLSQCRF